MFTEEKSPNSSTVMGENLYMPLLDLGGTTAANCEPISSTISSCKEEIFEDNGNSKTTDESKDKKIKQDNRWMVEWSAQEDQILFEKYIEIGSKWVELTKFFQNKSDNAVKNRFYCCMRKVQKKMSFIQKEKKYKQNKPVGYESLLTVLEIGKYDTGIEDKRFGKIRENQSSIMELRELIIEIARQPETEIEDEKVMKLIDDYLDLKHSLKFINIKRVKRNVKKSNSLGVSQMSKESTRDEKLVSVLRDSRSLNKEKNNSVETGGCLEEMLEIIDIEGCVKEKNSREIEVGSCQEFVGWLEGSNFDDLFFI